MGLLDDLKQQADKARLEKEREAARQAALERTYREGIRPAMLKIHSFLVELSGLLTEPVMASFEFPGLGRVDNLEQKGYKILIDSQRDPKLIVLRFECAAKDEKRYVVSPKSAGDEARQFLTEQKVMFSDWVIRDTDNQITGLVIQCKLRVPGELAFEADTGKGGIRVTSYNYDGVAEKHFLARHESVDADWLDKLGYYILRQDIGFGTFALSEEERQRIRALVAEKNREKETLLIAEPQEEDSENGRRLKWLNVFNAINNRKKA